MSISDIASVCGLIATVVFGIWAALKGKLKRSARSTRVIWVLAILYSGQVVGYRLLGKPIVSDTTFGFLVTFLVIGVYWMVRDE